MDNENRINRELELQTAQLRARDCSKGAKTVHLYHYRRKGDKFQYVVFEQEIDCSDPANMFFHYVESYTDGKKVQDSIRPEKHRRERDRYEVR